MEHIIKLLRYMTYVNNIRFITVQITGLDLPELGYELDILFPQSPITYLNYTIPFIHWSLQTKGWM